MKITGKTLSVTFENDVTVGNGAIQATLVHQAWVSENNDGTINVDIDFADVTNVQFMGMPIEDGYKGFKKFKETMSTVGINVDNILEAEALSLITDKHIDELKRMYKF